MLHQQGEENFLAAEVDGEPSLVSAAHWGIEQQEWL